MYNKFYGVIGNIKIIQDNNLISVQDRNYLLDKIKNTNLNYVNIDSGFNGGIFDEDEESIRKLLQQIKKSSIKTVFCVNINENSPWESYIGKKWMDLFDIIIINLKIPPYLINKREIQKIIMGFFYINENKLILSENFLFLEEDILKKYCQGILINNNKQLNHNYGTTIFNGLNFFQDNFWNELLFQKNNNLIHCTNFIGWQPLEILHSAIVLNDNQLKISIIENIQSREKYIFNKYNNSLENLDQMEEISQSMDNLLQKTNDLLYDINN
jgi:hypothetical protein